MSPSLNGMDEEDFDYVPSWVQNRQPEQPLAREFQPVDRDFAERMFKMFKRPFDRGWEMPNFDGPEYRQQLGPSPLSGKAREVSAGPEESAIRDMFDRREKYNPSTGPVARTMEYNFVPISKNNADLLVKFANGQEGGKNSDLNMWVDPLGMFPQYDVGKSTEGNSEGSGTLDRYRNSEVVPTNGTPSLDNRQPQIAGSDHLGYLSAEGESNSNPGEISSGVGDKGGKSYGAFQFASEAGVPKEFMTWLANNNPDVHARLEAARQADGSDHGPNFDAEWKKIASKNPEGFLKMQYDFTKNKYYDRAADTIKAQTGFDFNNRGYALKNVLWSRAVHHGEGGAVNVVKNALKNVDPNNATDEQIIKAIYAESGSAGDHGGDYITENGIIADPKHNDWHLQFAKENNLLDKSLKYFDGDPAILLGVWNRLNITEPQKALDLLKKHG